MTYIFRGQLSGEIASDFCEPLAGATLRLYQYRGTKYISGLFVADPSGPLTMMSPDTMRSKMSSFMIETTADAQGRFVFELDEQSGYKGAACELDLFLTSVPGRKSQAPLPPVQIALTTIRLKAQDAAADTTARWAYCLLADFWREVRARFDAWVICGRVISQSTAQPVPGIRVSAVDADWIQDDTLGSALTDDAGKFRIDYARDDFTRTPLSPVINREEGGPDLYFKLATPSGSMLLDEPKPQGQMAERKNAGHGFFIEFKLETVAA